MCLVQRNVPLLELQVLVLLKLALGTHHSALLLRDSHVQSGLHSDVDDPAACRLVSLACVQSARCPQTRANRTATQSTQSSMQGLRVSSLLIEIERQEKSF
jgi:hypothetical protein